MLLSNCAAFAILAKLIEAKEVEIFTFSLACEETMRSFAKSDVLIPTFTHLTSETPRVVFSAVL